MVTTRIKLTTHKYLLCFEPILVTIDLLPNTFPNTPSCFPLFLTRNLGIETQSNTPRRKLFTTLNHWVGGLSPSQPTDAGPEFQQK